MTEQTDAAEVEALGFVLDFGPLRCTCGKGQHDFCGTCTARYVLASDWYREQIAAAEARGAERALREAAEEMDRAQRVAKTQWKNVTEEDERFWRASPLSDDALFDARPLLADWLRARAAAAGGAR